MGPESHSLIGNPMPAQATRPSVKLPLHNPFFTSGDEQMTDSIALMPGGGVETRSHGRQDP